MTKQSAKFLKTLLATASAASILMSNCHALAANNMTTSVAGGATTASTSSNSDWSGQNELGGPIIAPGFVVPAGGDNIILGGPHSIILNSGQNLDFGKLQIGSNSGKTLTVGDQYSYSFTSLTNGGGAVINIVYGSEGSLALSNTNKAIGNIDFAGHSGSFTVGGGEVSGNITTTADNTGMLKVTGNAPVALDIGSDDYAIAVIDIGNGATLAPQGDVNTYTINLNTASSKLILAAKTLRIKDSTTGQGLVEFGAGATLVGALGNSNDANNILSSITLGGNLTMGSGGAGAAIVAGAIAGAIGTTITIVNNSTIQVGTSNSNTKYQINDAATLTLNGGTFAGTIDGVGDGQGTLAIGASVIVNGAIGSVNPIDAIDIGDGATLSTGGNIKATSIIFATDTSELHVGANTLTIGTMGTTGQGRVRFGAGTTLIGHLGNDGDSNSGNVISSITLDGNLTMGIIDGSAEIVASTIGSNDATDRTISVVENAVIKVGNSEEHVKYIISATKRLQLDGGTFAGPIDGAADNSGELIIGGAVTLNGIVGATRLASINIKDGCVLTLGAAAEAANLNIIYDGSVDLGDHNFTGNINFAPIGILTMAGGTIDGNITSTVSEGGGTYHITGAATVTGSIGSVAVINVGDGATLSAGGDINTHTINFNADSSKLVLLAKTLRIKDSTTGQGIVRLANNGGTATLIGDLGNSNDDGDNVLSSVTLGGNLTMGGGGAGAGIVTGTIASSDATARTITIAENSMIKVDHSTAGVKYKIRATKRLQLNGGDLAGTIDGFDDIDGRPAGTLIVDGNVSTGGIIGTTTLDWAVEGRTKLEAIEISGGILTLGANASATSMRFTGAGTVNLGSHTFTGDVDFQADGTITANSADKINGTITNLPGTGNLVIGEGYLTQNLGANGARFNSVTVAAQGDGRAKNYNIYAETLIVGNDGSNTTFMLDDPNIVNVDTVEIKEGSTFRLYKAITASEIHGGILDLYIDPDTLSADLELDILKLNAEGSITRSVAAKEVDVNKNISLADTVALTGAMQIMIAAGYSLTALSGSIIDTGATIMGAGTFRAENGGLLPKFGDDTNAPLLEKLELASAGAEYIFQPGVYKLNSTEVEDGVSITLTGDTSLDGSMSLAGNNTVTLGTHTLVVTDMTIGGDTIFNIEVVDSGPSAYVAANPINFNDHAITINITGVANLAPGNIIPIFSWAEGDKNIATDPTSISYANGELRKEGDPAPVPVPVLPLDPAPLLVPVLAPGPSPSLDMLTDPTSDSAQNITVRSPLMKVEYKNGVITVVGVDKVVLTKLVTSINDKVKDPRTQEALAQLEEQAGNVALGDIGKALEAVVDETLSEEAISRALITTNPDATSFSRERSFDMLDGLNATQADSTLSISRGNRLASLGEGSGISAGCEENHLRSGAWVQGFGSRAIQSQINTTIPYRGDTAGAMVGADTLFSDQLRVGFALSGSESKMKMKGTKSGDKVNVKTYSVALYGSYEFDSN